MEAAGPDADRRGALACRPGPQASSLHSGRRVKSTWPGAGAALTPAPEPRVDTGRHPPGPQEGTAPPAGRPRGGCREGGTVARTAKVRATVAPAPAAGQPGEGTPGCGQPVILLEGSVMTGLIPRAAAFSLTLHKSGFEGLFSPATPKIGTGEAKKHDCYGGPAYLRWSCPYLRCTRGGFPGSLAVVPPASSPPPGSGPARTPAASPPGVQAPAQGGAWCGRPGRIGPAMVLSWTCDVPGGIGTGQRPNVSGRKQAG